MIFLSFCRPKGKPYKDKLSIQLRTEGFTVWDDDTNISFAIGLSKDIETAITTSELIIAVITRDCVDKDSYLRSELSFARSIGKNIIVIYPEGKVDLIDSVNLLSFDFTNWQLGYDNLLQSIDRRGLSSRNINVKNIYLEQLNIKFKSWNSLFTKVQLEEELSNFRPVNLAASNILNAADFTGFFESNEDKINKILVGFDVLRKRIEEERVVAILGEPGSGKTTTLQYLAVQYAEDYAEGRSIIFPIYVDLSSLKSKNIIGEVVKYTKILSLDIVEHLRQNEKIVFLLDGVNEMNTELLSSLIEWVGNDENSLFVLSSRVFDFKDVDFPFKKLSISPLSVKNIERFIYRYISEEDESVLFWKLAGKDTHNLYKWFSDKYGEKSKEKFFRHQFKNVRSYEVEKNAINKISEEYVKNLKLPHLLGFAQNPYLCLVLLQIYNINKDIPAKKGKILEVFVEMLMTQRGKLDKINDNTIRLTLKKELSRLAYRIQKLGKVTSLPIDHIKEILEQESIGSLSGDRILYLASSSGFISYTNEIKFRHQLLQEYFASYELKKDISRGVEAEKYWKDEWYKSNGWEETTIILSEIHDDPTHIIQWLIPANPTLAHRIYRNESLNIKRSIIDELVKKMMENVKEYTRFCPNFMSELYDNEQSKFLSDHYANLHDMVKIPRGETIVLGGDSNIKGLSYYREKEFSLSCDLFISSVPTTFSQFDNFVKKGYRDGRFWSAEGLEWKGNNQKPFKWPSEIDRIKHFPVVNVNFYECEAYCNWLNYVKPINGFIYHLPSEDEWEYASRYPDGRIFPWGDKYKVTYSNIDETDFTNKVGPYFLNRSTAVGTYVHASSELGLFDLSGNVWEWTRDVWVDYERRGTDKSNQDELKFRVIKGGSWLNSEMFARLSSRDYLDEDLFVNDIGFRVALSKNK